MAMHISNDNPFEAEALATLRADRIRTTHVLGDLPLIVLSRGLPEDSSVAGRKNEDEHKRDQSTRSGHHIPLDEPDLVATAIRHVILAAPR
jgi:hypothetical protein